MRKLLLNLVFLAMVLSSYAQEKTFSLQNQPDQRIGINQKFTLPDQIEPFTDFDPITGLVISGNITLNADSSLVRLILIDKQYNEYLVYEIYPLLADSWNFSINEIGEETTLLNNVEPSLLKIELIDASIDLTDIVTSKALAGARAMSTDRQQEQSRAKITKINQNLQEKNIPWIAGETSISQLSYQEKKAYFGGDLPNLYGFEYYAGGIFVMPGALDNENETDQNADAAGVTASPYVPEFSWSDFHGQDWVTSVKSQGGCGSCWAFAAAGATEVLANLYYNRHLNFDLSEQELVSCSGAGSCSGGRPNIALSYIASKGLTSEDCFPYMAYDAYCSGLCTSPTERVKIGGYTYHNNLTADILKSFVIHGPVSLGVIPWRHAITLVGYKTLVGGERIYIRTSTENRWVTIDHNSPLVGRTAWLIKNSWGSYWGDDGYAYVLVNVSETYYTYKVNGPVETLNYSRDDIVCSDNDGDGYYFWGLGPKPAHCPPCPDAPDGDDSNPCFGPRNAYGYPQSQTQRPGVRYSTLFEGQTVTDLAAFGSDLKWYSDYSLTNLIHTGGYYAPGQVLPGVYTYYVTQTKDECESLPMAAILTIHEGIAPPEVESKKVCQGSSAIMHATGEGIKWYSDAQLSLLIYEGNDFASPETDLGTYTYYVTQTVEGIEGPYATASYSIRQAPLPVYVDDKVFCSDSGLFMYAEGDYITWYRSNIPTELFDKRNNKSYRTVQIGHQVWMAENLDIGQPISGLDMQQDNGVIEKYQYNDDPLNGASHGGLYQWDEMMTYSTEIIEQGVCPAGWHIPSNEEWKMMELTLGMSEEDVERLGLRGTNEGALLKEGGASGFESLLGGKRNTDGLFDGLDYYATYWTSDGYTRTLSSLFDQVYASNSDSREDAYSVRCVLDDSVYVSYGRKLDVSDYTPGDYTFYISNTTYDGCISQLDTATLRLRETPPPPVVSDMEICVMEDAPILLAEGENVKWYHDIPEGSYLDDRNDKTYNMLRYGKDVWMGENLDIGTMINGAKDQTDNQIIEKYYYNNDPTQGAIYGGLYQWNELMSYSILENSQGICPDGWEVPSHKDWMKLEMELGMNQAEATLFEWRGTDQGNQLKVGGSSGFNALFGGKRSLEGQFKYINTFVTFWNSTTISRTLENGWEYRPQIWNGRYDDLSNGFSVRCIMNDSAYTTPGNEFVAPNNIPGIYSFEVTQTVDACESRSATLTLTIKERPLPPEGTDVAVCEGEPVPALKAGGESVNWYSDDGLSDLVNTGSEFQTGQVQAGTYSYYITVSMGDCESFPDTIVLNIKAKPDPPSDTVVLVCGGAQVPELFVRGENIHWFTDEALLDLVHSGSSFATGRSEVGTYIYYTTETLLECMSSASSAKLVIKELPLPPHAQSREVCDGDSIPELMATGENIRWYDNPSLEQVIHFGSPFESMLSSPGSFLFYATQTREGCQGLAQEVELLIHESPIISLGNDTAIRDDETMIMGPYPVEYNYLWNDTSKEPYLQINGEHLGPGDYQISVQVSNDDCVFRDTMILTVESTIGINTLNSSESIKIYPNPTENFITVEFTEEVLDNALIDIIDSKGAIVQKWRMKEVLSKGDRRFIITLDTPGVYYLQIYNGDQISSCTVIRY